MTATKVNGRRGKSKGRKSNGFVNGMVDFNFHDTLYQIDPARHKVYRRWVEVETSKTYLIMGAYSTSIQARAE